jgi:mycofactocin biosynthesis protein MftB
LTPPVSGYALHPQVGLREERFGALAYHYGNRRLTFLNDTRLLAAVRSEMLQDDVDAALSAVGVPPSQHGAYKLALQRLAEAEVLVARD